jgi:hypothetical protein
MAYTYDRRPLYHGTYHDFQKPKLNGLGILWLAPNPVVAAEYATPYYSKGPGYVWKIQLKGGAKIVDLADLSQPAIRALFENVNEQARYRLGPWSEEDWRKRTDFGMLETYRGSVAFLKSKRIDGITCRDSVSTMGIPHDSVGLFKLSAIETMERQVVEQGKARTIGEIQKDIDDWKAT